MDGKMLNDELIIIHSISSDIDDCSELLFNAIGNRYYPSLKYFKPDVEKGISEDELWCVRTKNDKIVGVLWYTVSGCFYSFPYLHMIAVDSQYRASGIGTMMLDYMERQLMYRDGRKVLMNRVFLTVSTGSTEIVDFYRKRGYQEIGNIEGLFRKNITEKIMMKSIYS